MHALRWIAYSTLAALLLVYGLVALDVRVASADAPGGATAVSAAPDAGATMMSYFATSPNYNPYYNYAYYNNYYPYYSNYYYNYNLYNSYNTYYPYNNNYYYNYYLYNSYNPYYPYYGYGNPYYP
jgi:hypothetical protein